MTETDESRRAVRSFVIRAGRVTAAQQRALVDLWPRYGVVFGDHPLDLTALFGREAPCTLEIGFGNGEHLATRAQAEPGRNFLGIEVHRPGIGHLLRAADAAALTNLHIIDHDAVEALRLQIGAAALDEIQILFPDPWPKKRHHKRRLIQPEFAMLLATRLRIGGRVMLATDWAPYAEHMRWVLDGCRLLKPLHQDQFAADSASRVPTRFERRGLRLGHVVSDMVYQRQS